MPERRTDQETGETTLTCSEIKLRAGYVAGGRDGARVAVDQGGSPGSASNTTRSARFTTAAKAPRLRGDESTVSRILASTFGCSASKISREKVSSSLLYSPLFSFILLYNLRRDGRPADNHRALQTLPTMLAPTRSFAQPKQLRICSFLVESASISFICTYPRSISRKSQTPSLSHPSSRPRRSVSSRSQTTLNR